MIIRDKQDLRRCVKQAVRRADVVETAFAYDTVFGHYGVAAMMENMQRIDPLCARVQELCAALDAMDLPVHDFAKAQTIIDGYDRASYLGSVLRSMRARRVLVKTPLEEADRIAFPDARFAPLLTISKQLFAPTRYGIDYAACACRISEALRACGARDVQLDCFDEAAFEYCLLPVCEDEKVVLHAHIKNEAELEFIMSCLCARSDVRALLSAEAHLIRALIDRVQNMPQILVRVDDPSALRTAISVLGTHFVPYASHATLPEEMLGRWTLAREEIWPALADCYLPLARSGFEVTREQIEADVDTLLSGNIEALYL